MGPPVDTAAMTAVMSANRGNLRSFSSRCCAFRRTRTSADPILLLCIRLALPLTLSLPSRRASSARLVGVPPRALWPTRIFLRRNRICAGVVGTCIVWVLKGEEGGMMTPLLQLHGLMGEARFLGLEAEITKRIVCGAGACPFVVTRTALSWSEDKEGVTQVPCYQRVNDIRAEPIEGPSLDQCRRSSIPSIYINTKPLLPNDSIEMTEYPKQPLYSIRDTIPEALHELPSKTAIHQNPKSKNHPSFESK